MTPVYLVIAVVLGFVARWGWTAIRDIWRR